MAGEPISAAPPRLPLLRKSGVRSIFLAKNLIAPATVPATAVEPVTADKLHGLGDHLFLRQRATGRKTFIIRRKVGAKMTSTTLGDWPEWTLQRAKAAATVQAQAMRQ
jgi:hypothetical protein